jgi:hypothetical protein
MPFSIKSLNNPETKPILDKLERLVLVHVQKKLREKGHVATGKGYTSLEAKVVGQGADFAVAIMGEDYLEYQDTGRRAGKMPPVDPLAKWVQQKGIESDPKKARGIAFAIAKAHKRIGMHSTDKGRRIDMKKRNFLGEAAQEVIPKMDIILFQAFEKNFNLMVDHFLSKTV